MKKQITKKIYVFATRLSVLSADAPCSGNDLSCFQLEKKNSKKKFEKQNFKKKQNSNQRKISLPPQDHKHIFREIENWSRPPK